MAVARVAGDPYELQIMYGVAGERRLTEFEMRLAPRLRGASPSGWGTRPREQFQLDVYGEVIDAITRGGDRAEASRRAWKIQVALLAHLEIGLAPARRGHLGGPRAAPPIHALEGDGLGGLRSGG